LNSYFFFINLYDLGYLGTIFVGLALAILLWFTKKVNRTANRFLTLALLTIVLQMVWVLGINIRLDTYFPHWSWLPLQYSLALGPLIYLYVLKVTRQKYQLGWKDLIHLFPVLIEQGAFALELKESIGSSTATYNTLAFQHLNPVVRLLFFISVVTYLYWSGKLIRYYYRNLKFNGGDRSLHELKWLNGFLKGIFLLWLGWIIYLAIDYFHYRDQSYTKTNYPFYLLLAIILIRMVILAILRSDLEEASAAPFHRQMLPVAIKQKGSWLKQKVKSNMYYQDTELSLSSLAEKLDLHPHELSRIINTVLKKNFNDFINEYRVQEVIQKMQEPAYSHLTLLGIAFTAGFNSKSTFNRVFREMTGKSPAEYMSNLKKERPSYHLRPYSNSAAVILSHDPTVGWSREKSNRNFTFRSYLKQTMIKNYLKTIWRNALRHKANTAINVIGLALGISCWLFIFLWVQNEMAVDNFHAQGKKLYAVYMNVTFSGKVISSYVTPSNYNGQTDYLVEDIRQTVPQIKDLSYYATGYDLPWGHPETFQVGEKIVKLQGSRASKDFFKMFSYPLIQGNAENALRVMNGIAISRHMAEMFFGSPANAMGRTLRYENRLNFIVTAVFENVTNQSSLKFDFMFNWDAQNKLLKWASNDFKTYVQLSENADPKIVEEQMNQYVQKKIKIPGYTIKIKMGLQPYGEQHLHNIFFNGKPDGGRIEYVRLFRGVAIFILLIACINFMNLTTAGSVKRAKEIGVRKVIGSSRTNLIGLFYGESLFFSFLAMILSLIVLCLFLPVFNQLTNEDLSYPFGNIIFWISLISVTVGTGVIAGTYPAIYLSSLKPVRVLKGVLKFSQRVTWFRKSLTVFQFVLSIILFISTIVILRQTNYIENTHLGYNKDNLVYMRIEGELTNKNKYLLFKNEVSTMPGIKMVDRSTEAPHEMNFVVSDPINWQGKEKNSTAEFKPASVGFDFIRLMGLEIVQGRDFSRTNVTDSTDAFIVNEQAVKEMGMKRPIGQWISAWKKRGHIIGVLKDYHTQSLHDQIKPVLIDIKEGEYFGVILVRIDPGKTQRALQSLATVYKEINPKYPFTYQFVDQDYANLYRSEQVTSKLAVIFAIIAISISCLGLLGLAMFSAQQRIKEFGVRKVLGASSGGLIKLFAQDFLKLVFVSFLIASPLAWYAMSRWLQNFAYKVEISWWMFVLAGLGSLVIAFFTLSFEAFKVATSKPVRSLQVE
jgi:putative ABC transport system permease protein